MRSGSGIRILTTLACSIVLGAVSASAQQGGGMIVPGRDVKLGVWLAQPQVTQKGAVFQCVVERALGSGGRKADRLALVIGGGAGWGIQIVRAAWSLDPDKDHDALILVDGGRTVPVESYALDPNRLAIHPSDVPTFEAYLKRGTTMAIRSRSAGIDDGGLPLDGIGAAIDWLDRCGRQFALHGAPPEGAIAKPLAPVGAPGLAAPVPPPPPAPLPTPAQGPIVVTPPNAAVPGIAAVAPVPTTPSANPAVPAALPAPKPARPAAATATEPTAASGKEAGPASDAPSSSGGATVPMASAPGMPAQAAGSVSPATAQRPPAAAGPSPAAEVRPLALAPAKSADVARAPAPPPPPVEPSGPKALLPTTPAPAEPAAEAIGKVVRGKTDRAAVVVRGLPSDDADATGSAAVTSAAPSRRVIEPIVVRGERGSIVTAATRPAAEPSPAPPSPSAGSAAPSAAPPSTAATPSVAPAPAAPVPPVAAAGPAASAGPVPIGAATAPPAPTGPVRVIQGIAAYPSPYAAPSPGAVPPSGATGATTDAGGRVPFDGPIPKAKPR